MGFGTGLPAYSDTGNSGIPATVTVLGRPNTVTVSGEACNPYTAKAGHSQNSGPIFFIWSMQVFPDARFNERARKVQVIPQRSLGQIGNRVASIPASRDGANSGF